MRKFPVPDLSLGSIYELEPTLLVKMEIKLLLMDLDNTLASNRQKTASKALLSWILSLKSAGIEPFIFSNNPGDKPQIFGELLSIEYIGKAEKPKPKKLMEILRSKDIKPQNAAIIGDQIFTDVLCGVRSGVKTIVVRPIDMSNPFHLFRYIVEMPFRLMYSRTKDRR